MRALQSRIDLRSETFATNRDAYRQLVDVLRERQQIALDGGPGRAKAIARHLSRDKIMVRDRIDCVIDDGTPFLELSTLSGWGQYDDSAPGAGIVTGVGIVHGVPYVFIANDATVKGGSLLPVSIKKHVRAQDVALENGLGVIYLVDSGGAFLPLQDEIFPDKDHFGGSFYRQARMSAQGLPQLSVVLGGCTAGGAYVPALSDEVIMVEGIGRIFLGGPPIVKAALGEIIEPDDLGGAVLHTRTSGVSDYLAHNEREAYGKLREICLTLNQRRLFSGSSGPGGPGWIDWQEPEAPLYDPAEIYGIVSADDRIPFDSHEIIARMVDGSRFSTFKPEWGESMVCGFARVWGYLVGVIANQGIIFNEEALKTTHFIELCEQRRIPLLFLQNTSGYMVGRDSEARGIAKDGAKMVSAVANATVPRYTVLIGGAYGAGNYGMCGRGFNPRFLFAWPNSRIATMAANTAQTVLVDIRLAGMKGAGTTEEEVEALRAEVALQYETQSDPYYATSRLWDDGLIDPVDTRDALGLCLALAARQDAPAPGPGLVYRM
ncbi:MAG: methylcrotonoyl-CoA carboxylase [Deltaproteobacteria bacterium]|nr:methylcrotonoyl-CoA carboxylase [Deltaproteobacteria bacterium]MBW2724675.1 methylcrotonoyl-CoA carboxylase [Deltaproteobacteria bacterium]